MKRGKPSLLWPLSKLPMQTRGIRTPPRAAQCRPRPLLCLVTGACGGPCGLWHRTLRCLLWSLIYFSFLYRSFWERKGYSHFWSAVLASAFRPIEYRYPSKQTAQLPEGIQNIRETTVKSVKTQQNKTSTKSYRVTSCYTKL